ncbi:ABC transporter permease subunit [Neobacillus sp. PS3-34]|uniref:ABC transporter permease subunit n=1 Tax=Neobacillus sp. PS3-34 TaxID=3070678 RepID=UPI0027E037CC|nr:ABC transporter permease subunit [Neobacillus sp. PS3-34]WML48576.1 ABC transporter permease subunit [Neobacillus sp. PS3-34]
MKILLRLISSFVLWIIMAVVIILIVLLPRDMQSHRVGMEDVMSYHFTWSGYKHNIVDYFENVKKEKSLGKTVANEPVEWELVHYGFRSIVIIVPALFLSIVIGIYKGIFDYRRNRGLWKILGEGTTWIGQSVPDFFIILIIETIISLTIHRVYPHLQLYGYAHWYNIFLPIIFLSFYPASVIAGFTTQALKEEDEKDYILTARAKGLSEKIVLRSHILRNCVPKLLHHFMPITLTLLSSMFLVEMLTLYRAMGSRLMEAVKMKETISSAAKSMPIDTSAAICFSLAFMLLLLITQWISLALKYYLVPASKEEQS